MDGDLERLERHLVRLAQAMDYPPAPSLAAAVTRRLGAAPERAAGRWTAAPRWTLGVAAAAALALALVLGVWAPGREAVADFFDRIRIFRQEEPQAKPGATPTPLPTGIEGMPVSLREAQALLGFPVVQPSHPGGVRLERALLQEFPGFRAVALFYEGPAGLSFVLFETTGGVGKGLGQSATASPVAGLGREAYWLQGRRTVTYYDTQGELIESSQRSTDTNTLVWDEGGRVFRLEGDLSREEAVRIAQSLR